MDFRIIKENKKAIYATILAVSLFVNFVLIVGETKQEVSFRNDKALYYIAIQKALEGEPNYYIHEKKDSENVVYYKKNGYVVVFNPSGGLEGFSLIGE